MAKSKNHTSHNQSNKAHKNGAFSSPLPLLRAAASRPRCFCAALHTLRLRGGEAEIRVLAGGLAVSATAAEALVLRDAGIKKAPRHRYSSTKGVRQSLSLRLQLVLIRAAFPPHPDGAQVPAEPEVQPQGLADCCQGCQGMSGALR